MIFDFTKLIILFSLILTTGVLAVISFVVFMVAAVQNGKNAKPISKQSAFGFMKLGLYFFSGNLIISVVYYKTLPRISIETINSLTPLVFWGWLPANLFAYLLASFILSKKRN